MNIQGERLARVEEQVLELKDKVDKIDGKLDDLLALRNKGAGVVWFISGLMGTGMIGAVIEFFHYYFGSVK